MQHEGRTAQDVEIEWLKAEVKSIKQYLMGLIASVFLLVVAYLFQQLQVVNEVARNPSATGGTILNALLTLLGL